MKTPINKFCTRAVDFQPTTPDDNSDGRTLEGYAAVFDTPTRIDSWEGTFDERIASGAFKKTLSERKPVLQFDHGHDARTGSVPIGAFSELREDGEGLFVQARLFDNPVVEPIRQAIEGQAITGMSFRFRVVRDAWTDKDGKPVASQDLARLLYSPGDRGPLQRNITEVQLFEAGPVVFPAYAETSVGVRSMSDDDRAALVAEYQRTMSASDADADAEEDDEPDTGDDDEGFIHPFEDGNCTVCAYGDDARAAKPAPEPYGAVSYADPGFQADKKKRYPVDTKSHVLSALSYIGKPADAAKYSSDDLARVKANIAVAAKKFGVGPSAKTEKKAASVDDAATRQGDTSSTGGPEDAALSGTSASDPNNNTRATPDVPVTRKAETPVKTKAELQARLDAIVARFQEIGEEFRDAALDDNVQAEYDGLKTERSTIEASVAAIEERQAELKALAVETPKATERGSDTGRQTPAFHQKQDNIYDLESLRGYATSAEDYVSKVRENALRAIDGVKLPTSLDGKKRISKEEAQERMQGLLDEVDNEAGDLAKRMLLTGSEVYERAFGKTVRHGGTAMLTQEEHQALIRAQALGTDGSGGYAVPFQLDPTVILTNAGVVNPIRQLARVEQIVGKQWQGVTSAGVTVVRGAEGTTAPDNSFTIAQPTVSTNRVQGFVPFNIEIDLAWGALRTEITRLLVDSKGREEDSFITGDGSTGTQPGGVLGSLSGNTVTAGGTAAFAAADVYALQAALDPRWEDGSSWLAHKAIYHKIRQFDTAGGAQFWASIGNGQPAQLLDYPDYRASAMPSALTTGNKIMLYGDFSQFLIVDRIGMNVELVPHIFDASNGNRPTGQRGVYAVWMNNSKILVPSAFKALVTG